MLSIVLVLNNILSFCSRSIVLKACWKDDLAMAEIMNHKGNLLKSMGINRNGKIYLSIEETL